MQVQSADSTSKIGFNSRHQIERAAAFVNMDDSQLRDLAFISSYDGKHEKKQKRTMAAACVAMPIVDSLASGILVKRGQAGLNQTGKLISEPLSTRVGATARTAGSWVVALAGIGVYTGIKRAIVKRSEGLQEFNRNHPVLSFLIDLGIIFTGLSIGQKKLGKFIASRETKDPELVKLLENKRASIEKSLNSTKFNKKVIPAIEEGFRNFAKKAPFVANVGRFALGISPWIVLFGGLMKLSRNDKKELKRIDNKYKEIKTAQNKTAKYLSNALGVERDVLAQDQPILAFDLRNAMNRTHHPEPEE